MIQKNIIVENLNINYYQSNDADRNKTVVFLHGWASEALIFRNLLNKCSNFITVDFPGFGKSDFPQKAWGVSDYSDFLGKFLNNLNIKNPILIGHSFGGRIIIKYCAQGGTAKKIIIIGGAGIRNKSLKLFFYNAGAKAFKFLFSLPGLNVFYKGIRGKFYKAIKSEDYVNSGKLKETFKKIISEDLSEDIRKIRSNTVLIWGEKDAETPLIDGIKMNKLITNSKLCVIKDSGHYVFLDNPNEFNKIFLKELC